MQAWVAVGAGPRQRPRQQTAPEMLVKRVFVQSRESLVSAKVLYCHGRLVPAWQGQSFLEEVKQESPRMSLTLTWGTWGVSVWILAEPRSPFQAAREALGEAWPVALALASLSLAWRSKSSHMLCSLWATGISHLRFSWVMS